jgi:hypothetical protein
MSDESAIPAAHIDDVDIGAIAAIDKAAAETIARLGSLLDQGEETPKDFFRLVRLLHQVGWTRKAEYLLRRNLEIEEEGPTLYRELFGTEKENEFTAAVDGFAAQFSVELDLLRSRGFLDREYRTRLRQDHSGGFGLLRSPCEVRFDYANEDAVEADVSSLETEEYVILRWVRGLWHTSNR